MRESHFKPDLTWGPSAGCSTHACCNVEPDQTAPAEQLPSVEAHVAIKYLDSNQPSRR